MPMRKLTFLLIFLPLAVAAQDRQGNDTASDRVVDHYEPFEL